MGQTLTHGVYLPDEGERNCYNGLASNWSILDGAVGTIAEHTTALAGKAPAVHTHTKSDITDFPAYGTTAGTICEGNDSRLSDARTPVAHTHTKSDVTDLLNSNFIPSANNSYDLGSSSYQWNNLYAKNYYYNGTQWGLDRNNTWTGTNTFTANNLYHIAEAPSYILKSSTMQEGVIPSGNKTAYTGYWMDKNLNILGYDRFVFYSTGLQTYEVNIRNKATNGSFDPNGSLIQSSYQLSLYPSGNSELKIYAHTLPNGNGTWNLGDSNHKWKTLNGVNPGALSLPKIVAKTSADVSSAIVGSDGETQYLDGSDNYYTAALDGWISMCISGYTQSNELWITVYDSQNETWGTSAESSTSARNNLFIIFPIRANQKMRIRMRCNTVIYARFYPCEGNV